MPRDILNALQKKSKHLGVPALQRKSIAPSEYASFESPLAGFGIRAQTLTGVEPGCWPAVEFGQWALGPDTTSGRGGLACMWLSLFATFVQASQKQPLMWNACDAEVRVAAEHDARAAQLENVSASL